MRYCDWRSYYFTVHCLWILCARACRFAHVIRCCLRRNADTFPWLVHSLLTTSAFLNGLAPVKSDPGEEFLYGHGAGAGASGVVVGAGGDDTDHAVAVS
jgi:hypothetical protein